MTLRKGQFQVSYGWATGIQSCPLYNWENKAELNTQRSAYTGSHGFVLISGRHLQDRSRTD